MDDAPDYPDTFFAYNWQRINTARDVQDEIQRSLDFIARRCKCGFEHKYIWSACAVPPLPVVLENVPRWLAIGCTSDLPLPLADLSKPAWTPEEQLRWLDEPRSPFLVSPGSYFYIGPAWMPVRIHDLNDSTISAE